MQCKMKQKRVVKWFRDPTTKYGHQKQRGYFFSSPSYSRKRLKKWNFVDHLPSSSSSQSRRILRGLHPSWERNDTQNDIIMVKTWSKHSVGSRTTSFYLSSASVEFDGHLSSALFHTPTATYYIS